MDAAVPAAEVPVTAVVPAVAAAVDVGAAAMPITFSTDCRMVLKRFWVVAGGWLPVGAWVLVVEAWVDVPVLASVRESGWWPFLCPWVSCVSADSAESAEDAGAAAAFWIDVMMVP
jgi:hypothetical protein